MPLLIHHLLETPTSSSTIGVNDILITLRHWINDRFVGFEASYSETDDKLGFIEKCKQLVLYGWTLADDNRESSDFFQNILQPALVKPSNTLFITRKLKSSEADPTLIMFAKYCLFREILELYKRERVLLETEDKENLKQWFLTTKDQLDKKFNAAKFNYKGKNILTTKQLQELMRKEEATMSSANYYFIPIAYISIAMMIYKYIDTLVFMFDYVFPDTIPEVEIEVPREVKIPFFMMLTLLMLYGLKLRFDHARAFHNHSLLRFSSIPVSVAAENNINIQKFIFVNDEDIAKLFDNNSNDASISAMRRRLVS